MLPLLLWRSSTKAGNGILNSQIWSPHLPTYNAAGPKRCSRRGQRRGGASRRAGVGAKYFNNSSLTGRARRGERRSVPDTVGAAARGDRSALVLHAEVSENISEHTNNSERNIKREAGKDTGHADHKKA